MQWVLLSRFLTLYLLTTVLDSAMEEALSEGLTLALCSPSGSFLTNYQGCEDCIATNSNSTASDKFQDLAPFEQYISYCATNPSTNDTLLSSYLAQQSQLTSLLSELNSLENQTKAPGQTTPSKSLNVCRRVTC